MKKQFLPFTVSVLLFMAVLLPLASCKSENQSALRQRIWGLTGKISRIRRRAPLQEMDLDIYFKAIFNEMGSGGTELNDNRKIILSNDVEYFENKNDREPALVLKKGTTIYIHALRSDIVEGYGLWTWPDYRSRVAVRKTFCR